ncbi:dimethylaniline monooxygenase [N-oxide-forming] 2-like isoform X2 [Hyperolius riggenbachi]|uniref:dimethylaniline monooxygenase [N-oxide-forming] 2-like isoform X2 n=1 Tax=Hyperolius riggenbachi TaxID=752182 RepID=UPI0035A2E2FB
MAKKVAIIGAGCSGLAAIKCCLEEGLEPTCFEKCNDIGGLWRYTESVEDKRASLYTSVVTNTSKEMTCYSDFPMPEDFPTYLHHSKVLQYLRLYANHFRLLKYIQFEVYLSTREGTWVLSRISKHGYPIDMALSTRLAFLISSSLPLSVLVRLNEKQMNSWFDHENYGLKPKNRSVLKEPMVNDYLPSLILYGAVRVKPNISRFTETSVIFEDGTVVEDLDEVIFATGYNMSFPFLDDSVIRVEDNKVPLYKNVFPLHHEKPTLAFLGLVQPLGSILPVAELQARWATRIFKGIVHLPSVQKMKAYYKKSMENKKKCFGHSRSHGLQSYYIAHMDEIAVEIGVRPSITCFFLTDPKLAWNLLFGPCTAYQYRLTGSGKWTGARKAILSQWSRTLSPAKTRVVHKNDEPWSIAKLIIGLCVLSTAILLGFNYLNFKN